MNDNLEKACADLLSNGIVPTRVTCSKRGLLNLEIPDYSLSIHDKAKRIAQIVPYATVQVVPNAIIIKN
jgi:hypothetical protein